MDSATVTDRNSTDFPAGPGGTPSGRNERPAPGEVTRGQEAILSAEEVLKGRPSPFHLLVSAEIDGPLDAARLYRTLGRLTRRHPALRTVFARDPRTGGLTRRELTDWVPAVLSQELPSLPSGTDAVGVVHTMLADTARTVLRPFDCPPVVFVGTQAGPERFVLSVLAHHAVMDGWSFGLLWEELVAGYAAGDDGPELEAAPGMEAVLAREKVVLSRGTAARRAGQLADWPQVLELPGDLDRPEVRSTEAARLPFTLSARARVACDDLTNSLQVRRNAVLLAAWALVLARRASVNRLLVGTPTMSRTSPTSLQVIGGCAGLGVVACEVPAEETVAEYVRGIGRNLLESIKYSTTPFEDVVAALGAGSDPSRSPLVQFAFGGNTDVMPGTLTAGDVTFRIQVGHAGGTGHDAVLQVMQWEPQPLVEIEYATSVISSHEAMELAHSFDRALVEMAADTGGRLADVTTVTAAQRERTACWGEGPTVDASRGLWQLIEETAERVPDSIAIRGLDAADALTYRQLLEAAAAQSAQLSAAGVREGDRVAVAVPPSVAEVIAVLAVIRLGAAYMGMDPAVPDGVLASMLERAGVGTILGTPERLDALGAAGEGRSQLAAVDHRAPLPDGAVPPPAPAAPERVAYLAFTSGTTGPPKGTMVPCRGVVRLVTEPVFLAPGAISRFGRTAPLAFDGSTFEIFGPLTAGGTIEVFRSDRMTPASLTAFVRKRGITGLFLTTGLFRLVADYRPDAFHGVVQVLTGGDVTPATQVERVLKECPGLRVTNLYGPTENSAYTTYHHVDDPAAALTRSLPIGRPIQGTGLLVLNPVSWRPVPPGGIGELFTSGDGVCLGYAGMPAESAAAFGMFGHEGGPVLYRTGDLVRWDAHGNLMFHGRRDHQVKIRGFRVELEHVAAALRRHPRVRDVALAVITQDSGDRQILAGVSPAEGPALTPQELRTFAADHLPAYALPSLWAVADELPVNKNGKLSIDALRRMATTVGTDRPSPNEPAAAGPATAGGRIEETIAEAWCKVLGHRDFGHDDWFFDVGGDSLNLIRVHTILGHTLPEHAVTIGDLYACSTIKDLAVALRSRRAERTPAEIPSA
ncbi:amino acid adenylation domain-containing protein [Streptomyces sp. NPDC059651]|uniref:non-ribosomal peptide synthetase n=1 Tax=Streptomyces sp. NPDC059651 TaxID=3346897 RepID=UPI00368B32CC